MDFMIAAGVRLCAREGVVRLPDEESLLMVGGPEIDHVGLEVPVRIPESTYIQPGRSVLVPVKYAQADPEKVDEWAGHDNGWVSQFLYGNGRKPKAVKVVNISDQVVRIPHNTVIACLVEKCHLPVGEGFARPRSQKYQELGKLVYEAEPSPEFLRHEDEVARLDELNGPPAVERPNYKWPEKLLLRRSSSDREPTQSGETGISPEEASAYIVCTNPRSNEHSGTHCENRNSETSVPPPPPTSDNLSVEDEPRLAEVSEDRTEFQSECKSTQLVPENGDSEPEVVSRSVMGGGESARKAQEELGRVFPTPPVALPRESVSQLREALARCMRLEIDFSDDEEATMYLHEGSELLSDLRNHLAALPELRDLSPEADLSTADVGVPGVTTPEMDAQIHTILERHHGSFLGDGNAVPTPARGVICDLDVGDAQPVAQRSRPIRPEHLQKVYDLLKKLLETKLVEYSDSQWASPIVIVMKKNGVDIRLCIDYRLVNQLIKLMYYPLPLIDDLLIGFESAMWFLSLDMASGYWAVPMTLRAQHISAFICPLGHFQWTRMPFGLKAAPLIYQQMLDNCLWGFVRLPPGEEAQVDPDVLQFLGLKAEVRDSESDELPALTEALTVFRRNIPAPPQMNPVLGRSSYIDDIAYGTETWDQLCLDLDRLLYPLRFDGAAKLSDRCGTSGCILWKLPSWEVVEARGFFFENITVNEAEYHGLLEGSKMALARGITELVVVGDSRIAIQQAQGLIRCLKPGLQLLLAEFEGLREKFRSIKLVHVKREYNAAADYLTTKTLLAREPVSIDDPVELAQLRQLNKIPEKLMKPGASQFISPEPKSDPKVSDEAGTVPEPVSISEAAVPFTPEARIFMVTRCQARTQGATTASENANETDDRDAEEDNPGNPERQVGITYLKLRLQLNVSLRGGDAS
ncbi:hypothetical protein PR001_g27503 [Phytophthora rubi]|uniref:Reverse transcriptase domain-containing protein n=1 Tax=Phytophthora rubi TaxID=129364 RepID=A0A6A3HKG7_9STRA|nr:hypothetical protein PR001_g27503 [Phytophthora rubi]